MLTKMKRFFTFFPQYLTLSIPETTVTKKICNLLRMEFPDVGPPCDCQILLEIRSKYSL